MRPPALPTRMRPPARPTRMRPPARPTRMRPPARPTRMRPPARPTRMRPPARPRPRRPTETRRRGRRPSAEAARNHCRARRPRQPRPPPCPPRPAAGGAGGRAPVTVSGGRPHTGRPRRRNAAAVTHLDAHLLRPGPDARAVLAMGGRPALDHRHPRRRLARMLGKPADRVVEAVAVPGAQIYLVVTAIEAEPAHPMLARRNLFVVVVTGICDRNLLCHYRPPFP